ncbi:MAG: transketolase family protein [Spirochaetales bacterium]|jgi:transketolase|nr:transketolase family protein [Spirochaetales bacterium]
MAGSVTGKAMRQVYGETLVDLGKKYQDLVVLDADVSGSTRSCVFAEVFPERFFNVGIAEMNMAAMAAGLSTVGFVPFINTFACFTVLRCADPIRSLIAYTNLNVKVVGTYSGLSDSYDGASHHATMDMNFFRALPNFLVLSPSDGPETSRAVEAAFLHKGPVYLRMHRNELPETSDYAKNRFEIGKGIVLRDGKDVTLIATGFMVHRALAAADTLASQGISARVVNIHTIKPIDKDLIVKCASETRGIVTAEEHSITGGLGSAVAEVLAANRPAPVAFVGVENTFTETGDYESLLEKYGLTAHNIVEKAKKIVK